MPSILDDIDPMGRLDVEEVHARFVEVWFTPDIDRLSLAGRDLNDTKSNRVKIMELNAQELYVSIWPVITSPKNPQFLEPKYDKIREIVIEETRIWDVLLDGSLPDCHELVLEVLKVLPSGFLKDPDWGLGFAKEYRFLVEAVEELTDAHSLVISSTQTSNYDADNRIFTLSQREFNDARKSMDRITAQARNAASDVKDVIVYNALAPVVAKKDKQVRLRKNPTTKRFQQVLMNSSGLDEEDHAALVEMVTSDATRIARSQPEKLSALRDEVQLATLDALIVEYETMLSEGHNESDWQNFFQDQPLLLSMAFGYPIIQVEGHASVGGRKISGFGEKIADFLYQNGQTGNVALFEIKTPSSPLLETREYRGGLHAAHKELSGSVSQILDQRYQLQLHFASKIAASEMFALKSYAIDCCVVSGTLPTEKVKQKSLELIRHNSKDVTIITYDELLIKLKQLSQFLAADKESKPAK